MSCPADDMQRMSDTIDDLKRIIELMWKGIGHELGRDEARELERLMGKHCIPN